jgi:hypothetical protein
MRLDVGVTVLKCHGNIVNDEWRWAARLAQRQDLRSITDDMKPIGIVVTTNADRADTRVTLVKDLYRLI